MQPGRGNSVACNLAEATVLLALRLSREVRRGAHQGLPTAALPHQQQRVVVPRLHRVAQGGQDGVVHRLQVRPQLHAARLKPPRIR